MSLHDKADAVVSQALSQINKEENSPLWYSLDVMTKQPKDMFYCNQDLSEDDAKFLMKTLLEMSTFRTIRSFKIVFCCWTVLKLHIVVCKAPIFLRLMKYT